MSKESKGYKNMPKKIYIRTFGCQMNVRDSEIIKGLLLDNGFRIADEENGQVDAVLFVTCSVRQHAEDKVWSEIGRLAKMSSLDFASKAGKIKGGGTPRPTKKIVGLVGCMAENYKEEAFKRMPGIDLVVGTNNIGEIPRLLKEIFNERRKTRDERRKTRDEGRFLAVSKSQRDEFVYLPKFREAKDHSFVVISEGCDNFCSYCLVPYVRGKLRHREPENILKEIQINIKKGIESVTLIGQNVNSYKYKGMDFVILLEKVNSIKGLKEFSFVTSHPKDVADNLFAAMAGLKKLKKYLHLPAQSGSDRILELMKRGYGIRQYLALADSYRKKVPGGALTTDIIVGFPGETGDDFLKTLDLLREVRFNSAYLFKYSPRPHTEAGKLKDDVPKHEKERRHKILLETQKNISKELKAKQ